MGPDLSKPEGGRQRRGGRGVGLEAQEERSDRHQRFPLEFAKTRIFGKNLTARISRGEGSGIKKGGKNCIRREGGETPNATKSQSLRNRRSTLGAS